MNAKYYRFLFQNIECGICHTGSIVDNYIDEKCQFIYISGVLNTACRKTEPDKRFHNVPEYDFMILADLCAFSIHKAVEVLTTSKVGKVIIPDFTLEDLKGLTNQAEEDKIFDDNELSFIRNPYDFMKHNGVEEICRVEKDLSFICNGWRFEFAVYGEGIEKGLAVYHGSDKMDKKMEDSVMAVKYISDDTPCSVCINLGVPSCGMRCGLYNDFELCKKHNGAGEQEYIDGSLLLGTVNLREHLGAVKERFADVWSKIRIVAIPNGGNAAEWDKGILDIGTKGYKQYFVSPASDVCNSEAIKDIGVISPYQHFTVTSKEFGLCCSGFYKHREYN